jgi:MscS family membrane protein
VGKQDLQMVPHGILRTGLALLCVCTLVAAGANEQEPPALKAVERATPRAVLRCFYEAMGSVAAGNDERLPEAIACLYLGEDLTENERLNRGREAAEKLYAVLDNLQFRLDDVAEEVEGNSYTAELGTGGDAIRLKMHRYEDGEWRFNSETLSADHLEELAEAVEEKKAAAEEASAAFEEHMKSPRAAMLTFLRGMNASDGFTVEDALATLDLTHISGSVRSEVGRELAYQLKSVIDRYKFVEISELPPESERSAYIFLQEPEGRIVLDVVETDEDGRKAWKFTKATLDSIEDLYLKYKDRPKKRGVKDVSGNLPFAIRLRDWLNDNSPFLTRKAFYLQNWQWAGLFAVILFGMAVSRFLTLVMRSVIRRPFRQRHFRLDEKLGDDFIRPIRIALMAWFWLLGLTLLGVPPEVRSYLRIAAQVLTAIGAVWAIYRLIDIIGNFMQERAAQTENKFDDLLVPIVTRSLKIFVVVIAIVILADKAGQDPMKIVAGLGLGGLAFALAAKDVAANIFGSFTILLDRPFQIGDWVTIGNVDGTVESVGMRSTRVRTFYNSLITVPNSELISTSVDNWGERKYRRIKTTLSIAYDTPPEKIDAFCEGIRELIRKHPWTRKDYFHVYLNQFAAASLDILVYCFVEVPDWGTELRERHRLFNDIIRLARKLGIEFAFPTQTLYLRQEETPAHEDKDNPEAAMRRGRKEAAAIVRRYTGPPGTMPPPVTFEADTAEGEAPGGADEEEAGGAL